MLIDLLKTWQGRSRRRRRP